MSTNKDKKIPNVPNLRFITFSGSWKKCVFYQLADFFKGNGISKSKLSLSGNKCILYGELYTTYKKEIIDNVISRTNYQSSNIVFSKTNDVLIPGSGETPEDIATACCVKEDDIAIGGDLNIIRLKNHDGGFISYQLNGVRKIDIASVAQGKSIVHLHNNDLKKLMIWVPNDLLEECKISDFMYLIDKRIDTQSKIIEKIESQIISISKLMIKKIKSKIAISQICKFDKKTNHQSSEGLNNGLYPFFTNEEVTRKYFNTYDFNGEYIIANTGGRAQFKYFKGKFATMSDCLVIKMNDNSQTKFYFFVLIAIKKYIEHLGFEGSGLRHLNKEWFKKMKVPEYSATSQKLTLIINQLYEKLKIEEKILSVYKKHKAFFLKNMFI